MNYYHTSSSVRMWSRHTDILLHEVGHNILSISDINAGKAAFRYYLVPMLNILYPGFNSQVGQIVLFSIRIFFLWQPGVCEL